MRLPTAKLTALLAIVGVSTAVIGTAHAANSGGIAAPTTTVPGVVPTSSPLPPTSAPGAPTTLPGAPTTAPGVPTTVPGATTIAGATTTASATIAGALQPNAAFADIQAAIAGVIGPTTDLAGELNPFVAVPAGIPTPEGAAVDSFSLYLYPDTADPEYSYYSANFVFYSALQAPDLLALYQSGMPAAGFVQTGDSVRNDGARQIRQLTYEPATPTSSQDEITVFIIDDPAQDFLNLDISYGLDPALLQAYAAWPATIPLVSTATLDGVSISTFSFGGDISVTLNNDYDVPLPLAEAITQFQAGLAGTPYTPEAGADLSTGSINLTGGEVGEVRIYMGEGYPAETTSYMTVTGTFDITL